MLLHKGKITLKEISLFFGLKSDTLTKSTACKARYLDILSDYCDYKCIYGDSGRLRYILITEVFDEGPYLSRKDEVANIEQFCKEEWGKYDEPLYTADSSAILTNRYCNKYGLEWQIPHYISVDSVYITFEGEEELAPTLRRNPDAKDWWRIYDRISRYFRKHKDEYTNKRLYLKVAPNKLSCTRLKTEEEEQIYKLSHMFFSNATILPQDMKEIVEYAQSHEGCISLEILEEILPLSKEV